MVYWLYVSFRNLPSPNSRSWFSKSVHGSSLSLRDFPSPYKSFYFPKMLHESSSSLRNFSSLNLRFYFTKHTKSTLNLINISKFRVLYCKIDPFNLKNRLPQAQEYCFPNYRSFLRETKGFTKEIVVFWQWKLLPQTRI
jgi:hypothetical protein